MPAIHAAEAIEAPVFDARRVNTFGPDADVAEAERYRTAAETPRQGPAAGKRQSAVKPNRRPPPAKSAARFHRLVQTTNSGRLGTDITSRQETAMAVAGGVAQLVRAAES